MPAENLPIARSLDTLLEGFADAPALPVTDIAIDSRRITPGTLFLACRGETRHGLEFRDQARESGAVAIAYDASTAADVPAGFAVPLLPVERLGERLGDIANRFFDAPSHALRVIGVTGTNGKSTVAWMLARSLAVLGRRCGYSGTLGAGVDDVVAVDDMTSPDVIELERRLAGFVDDGADFAAIEVSSHALAQRRVDGVRFDAALFTNLSRDHLDYHGSMRDYAEAKARLFTAHEVGRRIINLDSEFGTELAARCGDDVITVSTKFDRVANGRPYVFVRSVISQADGSTVRVQSSWGDATMTVPLVGDFNVANAVIVLAYLLSIGVDIGDATDVLGDAVAPPGRMQRVHAAHGPSVYVDYAHTPNALEAALRGLRPHCRGRLWVVFGCGGERDSGKRGLMGRIAERLADRVVVTSDNPRGEAPEKILDDIVDGFTHRERAVVIEDRATAIAYAISNANAHDVILIAGKGHENYQILADGRREFSDYGAALANLDALAPGSDA